MGRCASTTFVVVMTLLIFFVVIQGRVAQSTHRVLDSSGWIIPPTPEGADAYSNWASNKTFRVGDTLSFNFPTGRHDVAQVSEAAYNSCITTGNTNIIGQILTTGPANVVLNSEGKHYYICTFSQHCLLGQKLAITVAPASSSSRPPATPSPTGRNITPPSSTTTPSDDCAPMPSPSGAGGSLPGPAGSSGLVPTNNDSNPNSSAASRSTLIGSSFYVVLMIILAIGSFIV